MKYFTHAARCCLFTVLLCLLTVSTGNAQDADQCVSEPYEVHVDMWNLPKTVNSNLPLQSIRNQFLNITRDVLNHVNNAENFEVSGTSSKMDPSESDNIISDMNTIRDAYCVRRGRLNPNGSSTRAYPYTALVRPIIDQPYTYEIRGLHLMPANGTAEDRSQLVLRFRIENLTDMASVILTGLSVETPPFGTRVSAGTVDDPRIEDVYQLIEQFGAAYTAGDSTAIINSLREVLNDDLLDSGEVDIFESSNKKNSRGQYQQRIGRRKSASTYLRSIASRIARYGVTEVTFDIIDVYRIPPNEEQDNVNAYRATVLQHYMYKKAMMNSTSETYVDSDYLAIDVVFNANNRPVIKLRKAGRGTFIVRSEPSGVDISSINGYDLSNSEAKTPLDYIINAPLQYHLVRLDNIWYDTETVSIPPPPAPEHESGLDTTVVMTHKTAYLVLNAVPSNRAEHFRHDIGDGPESFNSGEQISLNTPELEGEPPPGGTITSDQRYVNLEVTVPALNNYMVKDTTVIWDQPDTREVTVEFPKGTLEIASTPDASTALVMNPDGSSMEATTLASVESYATLPGESYSVQVSNNRCYQDDPDVDECRYHIPSRALTGITIPPGETTRLDVSLTPFLVRDETRQGDINQVNLERDGDLLTVSYAIEDNKDRDRKFMLDFDMFDRNTGDKLDDLDDQVRSCSSSLTSGADATTDPDALSCLGDNVRPGTHSYTWDMSSWGLDDSDEYLPVLSLRRKGTCWPCILIPVAAGTAAAIIFPRTGSNEVPDFVPPPRPTETQNR